MQRLRHEADDFRYKIQMNALALADTTHSVSSLRIISEHHVLADGDDGTCGGTLLDVDTGGVNLIEEGKSAKCRLRLKMIKMTNPL